MLKVSIKTGQNINLDNPLFFDFQDKFLQIKALAERGNSEREIEKISRQALSTLSFVLFASYASQTQLELTSVSAAGAVADAASEVRGVAKLFGVDIVMDTSPKLDLVYSHQLAIKAAVFGLLSGACTAATNKPATSLTVSVQQTNINIQRIGIFSSDLDISLTDINKAKTLANSSRMSAPSLSSNSGAGFVLAQKFVGLLSSELQTFSHKGQKGVGFYVPLSHQLSLV